MGERFALVGDPSTYVISYPRSGRTWLRLIIGKALCHHYRIDERHMLWTERVTAAAEDVAVTQFFHDDSDFIAPIHAEKLIDNKAYYRNKHVIFLTRAVDDLLVSAYFHATRRMRVYEGSIEEFIRDKCFGLPKIIAFYRIWHACAGQPRSFLHVTYEEMHRTPLAGVRAVLRCLGAVDVPDGVIEMAIGFASFANMRRLEESDYFKHEIMRPGDPSDIESYKVRSGVMGAAAKYLSSSDLLYIYENVNRENSPFIRIASK